MANTDAHTDADTIAYAKRLPPAILFMLIIEPLKDWEVRESEELFALIMHGTRGPAVRDEDLERLMRGLEQKKKEDEKKERKAKRAAKRAKRAAKRAKIAAKKAKRAEQEAMAAERKKAMAAERKKAIAAERKRKKEEKEKKEFQEACARANCEDPSLLDLYRSWRGR